jgi:hypothetical protein
MPNVIVPFQIDRAAMPLLYPFSRGASRGGGMA